MLKIGVFEEKWLSFVNNKTTNERNRRKAKTKTSHPNQYHGAAKSTRTESFHHYYIPLVGPKGKTIVKNLNKTLKNVLPSNVKTHIT